MKVSVVINNYNYEKYITPAIESVLNQDTPADEIIVVDDGSTDNSLEILEQVAQKHSNIRIHPQENQGQLMAILNGIKQASGDIVCLLDADDLYYPDHITKVKETFVENPRLGMRFCDVESFSNDGTKKRHSHITFYGNFGVTCIAQYLSKKFLGNVTSSLAFSKEASEKIHDYMVHFPFKNEWRLRADNCLIWLASLCGFTKYNSPDMSIGYRIHGNNGFSGKILSPLQRMEHNLIKSRFFEYAAQHLGISSWLTNQLLAEYRSSNIVHPHRKKLYSKCARNLPISKRIKFYLNCSNFAHKRKQQH